MAVSSVGTDLAQTIADNRVFVEQNFQGGSTPIDPNNVIRNGDMSQVLLDTDGVKRPMNWFVITNHAGTGGSLDWTYLSVSPDSSASNRAVKIVTDNSYFNGTGLLSRPFRITNSKYRIRVSYSMASSSGTASIGTSYLRVYFRTYDGPLTDAASAIHDTGSQYVYPTSGHIFIDQQSANTTSPTTFESQTVYNQQVSLDSTVRTVTVDWEPRTRNEFESPPPSDLPEWASIHVDFSYNTSSVLDVNIWEISAVPIGGQYPSWQGGTAYFGETDFDNELDVAPDAPRETEPASPLMNSIDIQVSDVTQGSPPKNRLMMALPRKVYTDSSGTPTVDTTKGEDGLSFLYPGVSDLLYDIREGAAATLILLFPYEQSIGDVRSLTFPTNSHNEIKGLNSIFFNDDANLDAGAECTAGWYSRYWVDGQPQNIASSTGDRVISKVGLIDFAHDYEPTGPLGGNASDALGALSYNVSPPGSGDENDDEYINSIGSSILNVKTVFVGTNWGFNDLGAANMGMGMDYVYSDGGNGGLNGFGTTLGNNTSSTTAA